MKVALLTGSVSRQGGGVFEAMVGLSGALRQQPGVEVHVLGLHDAGTAADADAWGPTPVTAGQPHGPRGFGYSAAYGAGLRELRPDIVHVHGLWMYASVAALWWAAQTGAACVISPHGMLDRWALDNAAMKKRIAGMLYQDRHFRRAACLHAVSAAECGSIRAFGLRNPVCVIPNGVANSARAAAPPAWRGTLPAGTPVLLYLGRLHPKKGLLARLDAWAGCADGQHPWHLVIAGWDDGGHRATLQARVEALRIGGTVHFVGPQYGTDKDASFEAASAFVLPSFSEGLPVAVLEAWSHGLPVLMTPHCNLPEGFEAGAALRIETVTHVIARQLRRLLAMAPAERDAMGAAGRSLVERQYAWPALAREMAAVYRWLLLRDIRPDCVTMPGTAARPWGSGAGLLRGAG